MLPLLLFDLSFLRLANMEDWVYNILCRDGLSHLYLFLRLVLPVEEPISVD